MDNLIHMLDDLIELARDRSSALRFSDRGNEMLKKMYTVGIYATILELASDISFLIRFQYIGYFGREYKLLYYYSYLSAHHFL